MRRESLIRHHVRWLSRKNGCSSGDFSCKIARQYSELVVNIIVADPMARDLRDIEDKNSDRGKDTMLADKLNAPIAWTGDDPEITQFLEQLQGNIVKGHGRSNVVFLFCRFRADSVDESRSFLRGQIERVRSALHQLKSTQQKTDDPFVSIFLTKRGYDYFGVPAHEQPSDPAFRAGMSAAKLNDPGPATWDSHLREPHVMIMVAVSSAEKAQSESTKLLNDISTIGEVQGGHSGELIGNQFFNKDGHGVENFGYVDGRSQPLVLEEDIPAEGGIDVWPKTEFPVNQFVVRDPGSTDHSAYGSYYVFRQLEQDVRGFKTREDQIVAAIPAFSNRDSAGVGRLESGTPFELSDDDKDLPPNITNNFVFSSNPPKCPHFAHIRKVNPRTDATRGNLMIRRGITYGTRTDAAPDPSDPTKLILQDVPTEQTPTGGVGLLFQAYQADIQKQFETTQGWANSGDNGGVDPVIGQADAAVLDWPNSYGGTTTTNLNFFQRLDKDNQPLAGIGPYIKLRGGGYFFAPSLPFLKGM
jgi:Dyp-type peroxidase family